MLSTAVVHAGEAANRYRLFPSIKRDQQQYAGGFPTQQPAPAPMPEAMAAPIDRQAALVAAPASPFQEHSMQSARRSHEETQQRSPYEQQQVGPPCGIMESRSWGEADALPAAPRPTLRMHASDGHAHLPVWREQLQGDGDTPRAVAKRPKNEVVADAHGAHVGPGYGPGHGQGYGPLGEPQSSDDGLSSLTDAYGRATPPAAMASPLQEAPAAGVRATLSQSSEIGVAPRLHEAEPRAQWTAYDAASFNAPVSPSR